MIENQLRGEKVDNKVVNDFCITFSTINGSGSATANITLLRSLFRMGIPVSGKNIFPSNIQGLQTWYTIRISKDGYLGRQEKDDIVVAMNPATIQYELDFLNKGGVLLHPDDAKINPTRDDIVVYPMPVKKIIRDANISSHLRDYLANMVYVGVLAELLGINQDLIRQSLDHQFKGKKTAVDTNNHVIQLASEWARDNLQKIDPFRVETMHFAEDQILTEGNTAGALGAIYGGCQFVAWYPITPASSLIETMNEFLPELRKDPDNGKDTFVVVQAEDELAAAGMTVGAGWSGLRAMSSTSGPGLSLMTEYLGLAYFAETPLVIWNVQRVGPSTGMPTRTAQGDLTMTNFLSHGDTQFVMLLPGSVNECFEFGWKSFDIADRLQTPVIILSDLDLGMNQWMTTRFSYPDREIDRGKILWEGDIDLFIQKHGKWGRYLDVDGDGIPYRTVPGIMHPQGGYFARGTGHDEYGGYSEENVVWERNLNRIRKKFSTAKTLVPEPVYLLTEGSEIGLIAFGSTDPAMIEARDILGTQGINTDYLRIRALPFIKEVKDFIIHHSRNYVVELNQDGQMRQLLILEFPEIASRLIQVSHVDGLALSASWVVGKILYMENGRGKLND